MSVRAPKGELNNADKSYAIGRGLCAIKANDNNNTDYLYYLLSFTRTELYSKMVGSTFEAVTVRDVRELITLQRSEEHTSELQSRGHLVCRLLLEKKKKKIT